jgi:hypothetical protein
MTRRILPLAILALTLALATAVQAADRGKKSTKGPWIHIEVLEDGKEDASVKVNLPLSLARSALEMAPDDVMSEGRVRFNHSDFTVADLRTMWVDLRDAEDGEYVTVEKKDETVRVSKREDKIFVHVDGAKKEKVRVEVPVALVDALLRGDGDELDVDAAVAQLQKMEPGEIIRVEDGEDLVRVWIE